MIESWDNTALKELDQISEQISTLTKVSKLFPPNVQANAIANFNPNTQPNRQTDIAEPIRQRLRIKTGREPKKVNELFGNPRFRRLAEGTTVSRLDRINIINQIANFLAERQTLLRSVSNAIRNLKEGVSINAPDVQNEDVFSGGFKNLFEPSNSNKTAKALTTPSLYRRTEIPQFLEHMIEYEDEDDIGPRSGRRFVLTPDRIVSLTISENPPPFTMITVNGLFGEGFVPRNQLSNLQTSGDGNAITSAYAVDYDMWYQYGLRVSKAIEAPFLSDPDSQCAPYAIATLLAARENILQGSVQVAGYNEYYQPGDVVYILDRNLLFYVKSVGQAFSYGKLDTTLELTYGHNPGEYIPTMLDIAGKILYNAQGFTGQFRTERQQTLGSARSLGALAVVGYYTSDDLGVLSRLTENTEPLELLLRGRWGERNKDILTNTLYAVSGSLNQVSVRRQKARIKIVYYVTGGSDDIEMSTLAESVRDWLIYPEDVDGSSQSLVPITLDISGNKQKTFGLNEDDVIIEEVDMTDYNAQTRRIVTPESEATEPSKNTQGPSSAAIQVTRALDTSDSTPSQFRLLLANSVLDIFVDYELVKKPPVSATDGLNEAGQAANAVIDAARSGRGS